jgi:hypothetical protein
VLPTDLMWAGRLAPDLANPTLQILGDSARSSTTILLDNFTGAGPVLAANG